MLEKYLSHTKETESGCLEWTRCFNTDGYPRAGNKKTSNLKSAAMQTTSANQKPTQLYQVNAPKPCAKP